LNLGQKALTAQWGWEKDFDDWDINNTNVSTATRVQTRHDERRLWVTQKIRLKELEQVAEEVREAHEGLLAPREVAVATHAQLGSIGDLTHPSYRPTLDIPTTRPISLTEDNEQQPHSWFPHNNNNNNSSSSSSSHSVQAGKKLTLNVELS
jgi:hypothetical protein